MAKLIDQEFVRQEFKSGELRQELFPMLTDFGVPDHSETVHSHGLNYITSIGRELDNVTAISECPIHAPNSSLDTVRPDSVWFDLETNQPLLVAEFERYNNSAAKQKKLKEKLRNLLIAYHQLDRCLESILFVYWSYAGVTANNIQDIITILDEGVTLSTGEYLSGVNSFETDCMVYHAVANGNKNNLKLNKWIKVR
ncbi:MAG: hypothetical protein ACQEP9_03780 [Bacillota bacterium]